ncbi:MAG: prolyl oligopeptidase family serine peptidase [Lentisphaeraceae bacterium]|nr:prolyl oligopeptidase family serine peptidase [Lentisphaeraceae bacterium]
MMCVTTRVLLSLILLSFSIQAQEIKKIPRKLPPKGIELPADQRIKIQDRYNSLLQKLSTINHKLKADVDIYAKAVKYALLNGEFYKKKDFNKTEKLLDSAHKKADELIKGQTPWADVKGVHLRGFYSAIDDSPQPYGIEIPDKVDLSKNNALIIWLHGRGDKETDLHFMAAREKAKAKYPNVNAITVHPLGRQCIGYKSAGETDILEMIEHVKQNYKIDENRIAMMGFSMGGAGAWHLGAHFAEKWAVVHPGAGFAETAQYNKMKKENYPAWYTQKLWGLYDVPDYARNLFNQPLIAYSGEVDKQKQAADVMEAAFKEHGKSFPHIIGAKMGHKYDKKSEDIIVEFVSEALKDGRQPFAQKIHYQTKTLRYPKLHWIEAHGLSEHWSDSRIDAEVEGKKINIVTKNISRFKLSSPWEGKDIAQGTKIVIDGQTIENSAEAKNLFFVKGNDWKIAQEKEIGLAKKPQLQGPIDDAFVSPFLVVTPSGAISNKKIKRWVDFEIQHLKNRWRELFRGDIRIKADKDVTADDIAKFNLVLWGTPESNSQMAKLMSKLPVDWNNEKLKVNGKEYSSKKHVPLLIYPNPENSQKYIVINSGPTFRENHDRTNSLQNPKLPDWAVIDISQDPDGNSPGKVVDANFFDEKWNWKQK